MNTSREQALRDIKQFLSLYDTGSWPGSTKYKMSIRIMKTNFRGENKSALKSELKEAIAKHEFKEGIENDLFKYLASLECDDYLVRDNASLVQATADKIISSLNDEVDGST